MGRARVVLVHWKDGPELDERRARLRKLGYHVETMHREGGEPYRRMKDDPPHAVVIDLSRLPSHGRHLGIAIRARKSTATLPIVFVGGADDKVARVQAEIPDAVYCEWRGIQTAIRRATRAQPKRTVTPARRPKAAPGTAYSGTPLPKKLGIREGSRVTILQAPTDFATTLGKLPEGVTLRSTARGRADVVVLFCENAKSLEARLDVAIRAMADGASLWIAWPKKASGIPSDLSGDVVRARGLETGLVDTKVCAIDATWSGLRFQRRRTARERKT